MITLNEYLKKRIEKAQISQNKAVLSELNKLKVFIGEKEKEISVAIKQASEQGLKKMKEESENFLKKIKKQIDGVGEIGNRNEENRINEVKREID